MQIIQEIPQQKIGELFPADIQCQLYGLLITYKNILHRREDCMKKVFESLKEQAKNIIDFEKKKMQPLTKEELASHQDPKLYYICGKNISKKIF